MEKQNIHISFYAYCFDETQDQEIFLLSEASANAIWDDRIDYKWNHYFRLNDDNWIISSNQQVIANCEENTDITESLLEIKNWNDSDIIWFCKNRSSIIQTTWFCFIRNWKCFMYVEDDFPILLNQNKKNEAIVFESNGLIKLISKG